MSRGKQQQAMDEAFLRGVAFGISIAKRGGELAVDILSVPDGDPDAVDESLLTYIERKQ